MLANRLKILLAERDLSIKDVVTATGLTRPSISNMVNNPLANISTGNVDKLCNYLGVSPTEFYDYIPWIFNFSLRLGTMEIDDLYHEKGKSMSGELRVAFVSGKIQKLTILNFLSSIQAEEEDPVDEYDVYVHLSNFDSYDEFSKVFKKMSPFFKHYVQQKMISAAEKVIAEKDKNHEFDKLISKSNGKLNDKLKVSLSYFDPDEELLFQAPFIYDRKLVDDKLKTDELLKEFHKAKNKDDEN